MPKKTRTEMDHYKARKVARTLVRLKHSLNADEEINEKIDIVDKKFTRNQLKGIRSVSPDVDKILDA